MDVISLTHTASGTGARIPPGFGFNCFALRMPRGGRAIDVLWSERGFEQGERRAAGSGIPLLFPFPGRIAGTSVTWEGKTYPLPAGDGRGNAIHGFVLDRPWRVVEQSETHAVGQFQASTDDPAILDHWPSDFRITARYELGPGRLDARYLLENPDERDLPCGFGTHPYFRLPLGGALADSCEITLPVGHEWHLEDMLPTGEITRLDEATPSPAPHRFGDLQRDNVYTELVFDSDQRFRSTIRDPDSGALLTLEFDNAFRECVVYTPPHREAICVEPYTCLPGAFHLREQGVDTGIRVLGPGESFAAAMSIRLE